MSDRLARRSEQTWVVELLEQSAAELERPETLLSQLRSTSSESCERHAPLALRHTGPPSKPTQASGSRGKKTRTSNEALRRYSEIKHQEETVCAMPW
jgi:hypothetical protein